MLTLAVRKNTNPELIVIHNGSAMRIIVKRDKLCFDGPRDFKVFRKSVANKLLNQCKNYRVKKV